VIRVEHLADVLIEITDTLVDAVDPIEFLQLITARCASMSRSLWAGVVLADPQGRLQLAAASTESAAFRELFELENAQGPWLDCFRTGSPVVNTDLTQAEDRWPVLVPRAVSAGFRSVSAFPLRGVKDVIGALNLFSSDPDHLEPRDVRSLQVLADVATIGLLDENSSHDWVLAAARLQHSLTSRITGGQAQGVLAETRGVSVEAATDLIDRHADRTHQHPDRVATAVLANPADPDLTDATQPQTLLTPAQVAVMFGVGPKTVSRWARTGQLPAVRTLGGHRRYRSAEVTRLLEEG